jgi:hypothetical protein
VSDYLWPIVASPFIVLIPAAIWWLVRSIRAQNWGALAGLIWFLGYISIYFARLPAYQHGRYIIPALPIMYLWGLLGFLELASSPRIDRRIVLVWQVLTLLLTLVFQLIGAQQNANDVLWIETEMVRTAEWVEQNVPADAQLAVHDIGALGYYVQNPIIDLAGLTTPEIVPFIRDEARLAQYLDSNSVDYLITFPSFYPRLASQAELLFEAGQPQFDENIQVFRWR